MIDALTRALLLKYDPHSALLEEAAEPTQGVVISKAAHVLPLATRVALARLQGIPEFVIKLMEAEQKNAEMSEHRATSGGLN
jgi:hypothetical protein